MRRFSGMKPGQQVIISLTKPSSGSDQTKAAQEFFDALEGKEVDGVSYIEKSFWDFGAIILPDNGDRPIK